MNFNILKVCGLKPFNLRVIFFYPPVIITVFQYHIGAVVSLHHIDFDVVFGTDDSVRFVRLVID